MTERTPWQPYPDAWAPEPGAYLERRHAETDARLTVGPQGLGLYYDGAEHVVDGRDAADLHDALGRYLAEHPPPETPAEVPFVAIGAGERAPWEDLDLNCPTCGAGPLELKASDPPVLSYITHCGSSWVRGPFRPDALRG